MYPAGHNIVSVSYESKENMKIRNAITETKKITCMTVHNTKNHSLLAYAMKNDPAIICVIDLNKEKANQLKNKSQMKNKKKKTKINYLMTYECASTEYVSMIFR